MGGWCSRVKRERAGTAGSRGHGVVGKLRLPRGTVPMAGMRVLFYKKPMGYQSGQLDLVMGDLDPIGSSDASSTC